MDGQLTFAHLKAPAGSQEAGLGHKLVPRMHLESHDVYSFFSNVRISDVFARLSPRSTNTGAAAEEEEKNLPFSPLKCMRATGWKGPLLLGASRTIPPAVREHANMGEPRRATGEEESAARAKARSQPPF
ncbi:hypothetical protein EYF80_045720 [Liparis tanakae]|uniref:Uncharacterized protein n=1 Tax=Liparis tanakae TaxID=230148 RepID=A0A4Z2FTP5_9TELE|nr:hypothetical protein EYF80_045720 [Liparis tanakae]